MPKNTDTTEALRSEILNLIQYVSRMRQSPSGKFMRLNKSFSSSDELTPREGRLGRFCCGFQNL
ncbi:MAG: hypothetical protein ACJAU6_001695, partial [Alphaproteobacteria bacterium]